MDMFCPRCKSENIREIEVPPYIPDDTKPHNKPKDEFIKDNWLSKSNYTEPSIRMQCIDCGMNFKI